jgi:hypothetical protein
VPVIRKAEKGGPVGSVIKKRRKRMAKKKHRKLLKKTRIQRRKEVAGSRLIAARPGGVHQQD